MAGSEARQEWQALFGTGSIQQGKCVPGKIRLGTAGTDGSLWRRLARYVLNRCDQARHGRLGGAGSGLLSSATAVLVRQVCRRGPQWAGARWVSEWRGRFVLAQARYRAICCGGYRSDLDWSGRIDWMRSGVDC